MPALAPIIAGAIIGVGGALLGGGLFAAGDAMGRSADNGGNQQASNNGRYSQGGGHGHRQSGGYGHRRGGYGHRRGGYGGGDGHRRRRARPASYGGGGYGGGGYGGAQQSSWQTARQNELSTLQGGGNSMQNLGSGIPQTVSDVQTNANQTQQQLDGLHTAMNTAFQNKDYNALAANLQQMQTVMHQAHSFQLGQSFQMDGITGQFNTMFPGSGDNALPALPNAGGTPPSTIVPPSGDSVDPNMIVPPGDGNFDPNMVIPPGGGNGTVQQT